MYRYTFHTWLRLGGVFVIGYGNCTGIHPSIVDMHWTQGLYMTCLPIRKTLGSVKLCQAFLH